ncbi:hypothetical protein [Synoicihabitans lomoniglobus]|uniref:Tetratricopeptide repeat protein n=1 Tax=Synoicihabitans lomoniglobus TaxID=2909285 RepID=A0AAF0I476_9BACT|nr:hypothetical protein [Opitutaceae bacterium LMO-M01]WED66688.1 hypothetical protein PXH66_07470 [Opitutaceae bacterium LMO-M01]
MKIPRLSFSWKPTISGRENWRLGLWILVDGKHGRRSKLRIMGRGLVLWLAALALMAYLGLVTAWFFVLNQRPHNLVTWADCVLVPVRWSEISRKRGDAYIAEGLAAMESRNWSEAIVRIQAGLARSPDNRNGRERLGMFFIAAGQRDRGLKLLEAGIERGYPGRDAMERFLRAAMIGDNFNVALDALDAALTQSGPAVDRDREWMIDQRTRVLIADERFDDVVTWTANQSQMSEVLHESRVIALVELRRFEEAHVALDAWEKGSGALGGSERVRVRLAREEGDLTVMRETLAAMRASQPMSPRPMVYSIVQEQLIGEAQAAHEQLQGYFIRFGATLPNLLMVARPLAEIEAWDLFDQTISRAEEMGFDDASLLMVQVDAAITRGDPPQALELLDKYETQTANAEPQRGREVWIALQRAMANHLQTGEEGSAGSILERIRTMPIALNSMKEMAERLERGGRLETSLKVWQLARGRYPNSTEVAREAERVRERVGETEVERVPEIPLLADGDDLELEPEPFMTRPEPEDRPELLSPKRFFERCDQLIAESNWGVLSTLISDLRRARPVWYASRQNDLLVREIALNTGEKNWPALISNIRFRLDGSLERGLEVMNVVRKLDREGERTVAEQVLREVERRHQNFPPARRQREDWEAAAEREKKAAVEAAEAGN